MIRVRESIKVELKTFTLNEEFIEQVKKKIVFKAFDLFSFFEIDVYLSRYLIDSYYQQINSQH